MRIRWVSKVLVDSLCLVPQRTEGHVSPGPEEAERQDMGAKSPLPQILLPLEERAAHFRDMLLERGVRGPPGGCLGGGGGRTGRRPLRTTSPSSSSCGQAACRTFRGQKTRKGTSPGRELAMRHGAVLATWPRTRLRGEQMRVSQRGWSPGRSAGLCRWPSCRSPASFCVQPSTRHALRRSHSGRGSHPSGSAQWVSCRWDVFTVVDF